MIIWPFYFIYIHVFLFRGPNVFLVVSHLSTDVEFYAVTIKIVSKISSVVKTSCLPGRFSCRFH